MSPRMIQYHYQLKPSGMVLNIEQLVNHIYVKNWPSFVQVMACRWFGIKLLCELIMYFQFAFRTNFSKILIEIQKILCMSRKCISKLSSANCQPYCSGVIVLRHYPNSTHCGSNEQWVTWSSLQPCTGYRKLGQIAKREYINHVTMQNVLPHSRTLNLNPLRASIYASANADLNVVFNNTSIWQVSAQYLFLCNE